jgi:hypothetical protein
LLLKDFSTGKRVEARYKGRGNWYKGVIANVNPDGTIDVTYDDGEVDLSLHSKYVRLVQEGMYIYCTEIANVSSYAKYFRRVQRKRKYFSKAKKLKQISAGMASGS